MIVGVVSVVVAVVVVERVGGRVMVEWFVLVLAVVVVGALAD